MRAIQIGRGFLENDALQSFLRMTKGNFYIAWQCTTKKLKSLLRVRCSSGDAASECRLCRTENCRLIDLRYGERVLSLDEMTLLGKMLLGDDEKCLEFVLGGWGDILVQTAFFRVPFRIFFLEKWQHIFVYATSLVYLLPMLKEYTQFFACKNSQNYRSCSYFSIKSIICIQNIAILGISNILQIS